MTDENLSVNIAVKKLVGFLEEAPGVKSSNRLFALCLVLMAAVIVAAEVAIETAALMASPPKPEPSFTGLNVALGIVLGKCAFDVWKRTTSNSTPSAPSGDA